jgi:hypothetical protein
MDMREEPPEKREREILLNGEFVIRAFTVYWGHYTKMNMCGACIACGRVKTNHT